MNLMPLHSLPQPSSSWPSEDLRGGIYYVLKLRQGHSGLKNATTINSSSSSLISAIQEFHPTPLPASERLFEDIYIYIIYNNYYVEGSL